METQHELDLVGGNGTIHGRQRLWIVAAEHPFELLSRYHYTFVDPEDGCPIMDQTDFLLLRSTDGLYTLFSSQQNEVQSCDVETFIRRLPRSLADASIQPAVRGPVCDMLMVSSKPGRALTQSNFPEPARNSGRTQLETVIFRLASMPSGSGPPDTVSALAGSIPDRAHLFLSTLFHREYADAAAHRAKLDDDDFYARQAVASYRIAQRQFQAIGMRHQMRTTRCNSASMLAAPLLPGFVSDEPRYTTMAFSAERLCGFAVTLGTVDCSPIVQQPCRDCTTRFKPLGIVALSDETLVSALSGLLSPRLRLTARTAYNGKNIVVTTGLFDEMRALLGIDVETPEHQNVAAIRIRCDTLDFAGSPYVIQPQHHAVFVGRQIAGRRRHRLKIEAQMLRGARVKLSFELNAGSSQYQYFS